MKISELIKSLQKALEEHGDQVIYPHDYGEDTLVEEAVFTGRVLPSRISDSLYIEMKKEE